MANTNELIKKDDVLDEFTEHKLAVRETVKAWMRGTFEMQFTKAQIDEFITGLAKALEGCNTDFVKEIERAYSEDPKDYLTEEDKVLIQGESELEDADYAIDLGGSLVLRDKLHDFICREIYPSYNDQCAFILRDLNNV